VSDHAIFAQLYGELLCSAIAAKDARRDLLHRAPSARVMSGKLAEYMLNICRTAPERPQEGIEVMSPRRALAPDDTSEPSRTSSDCSRVDHGASGKDWRQDLMDLIQAEVDEHVLHYRRIIASKTKTIRGLKRQLAKTKTQLG
jgi:hypothetical protein